jgi:hypothetical protein
VNNQDWIPVSERLPEERESMFAKFKGTTKWNKYMFEKTTDTVLCTVKYSGSVIVRTGRLNDKEWHLDNLAYKDFEVIAWMPFPEAYGGERHGDI